jgi:uncharacterized membrane protein YbhN (UPF0104 family)
LVFSILAVGGHLPWQGVLAAYGVTQLAAALPITPGGIGVVEGTLSMLLIAYHMPAATAVAAVILYPSSPSGSSSQPDGPRLERLWQYSATAAPARPGQRELSL